MVSVLMPVFNGVTFLSSAIDSIIEQSFSDFEFIIINDGSTDSSKQIIQSYSDPRIRYFENSVNLGLSATLNLGIEYSKYNFIARMDCDDISLPNRLSKQVNYLLQNKEVGIVGSWTRVLDSNIIYKFPSSHDEIKCGLLLNSMFSHPSVMMRKDLLKNFDLKYNLAFKYSQDYDFWIRCVRYFKVANIQEILLEYREHPVQMRSVLGRMTFTEPLQTKIDQVKYLSSFSDENEFIHFHHQLLMGKSTFSVKNYSFLVSWLNVLYKVNTQKNMYQKNLFDQYLLYLWFAQIYKIPVFSLSILTLLLKSRFFWLSSIRQKISIIYKCLFNIKNKSLSD